MAAYFSQSFIIFCYKYFVVGICLFFDGGTWKRGRHEKTICQCSGQTGITLQYTNQENTKQQDVSFMGRKKEQNM